MTWLDDVLFKKLHHHTLADSIVVELMTDALDANAEQLVADENSASGKHHSMKINGHHQALLAKFMLKCPE